MCWHNFLNLRFLGFAGFANCVRFSPVWCHMRLRSGGRAAAALRSPRSPHASTKAPKPSNLNLLASNVDLKKSKTQHFVRTAAVPSPSLTPLPITPHVWAPPAPRDIELSITTSYLGDISTNKEEFCARLLVDVRWLPSKDELKDPSCGSSWDPAQNFQLLNAAEIRKNEVVCEPSLQTTGNVQKWHCVMELEGVFSQALDLRSFPLDCQSLVVRLEMGNVNDMRYVPVKHQQVVLSVEQSLCAVTGWTWLGAAVSFTQSDPALSKQRNSYAQVIVEFKLARQWRKFLWRIVYFVTMILFSSLLIFTMHPGEEANERLSLIFTLLLTLVTFQYSVQDMLPAVPYMTLVEKYVLSCTVWLFAMAIYCSVVKTVGVDTMEIVDQQALLASSSILFIGHALLVFVSCRIWKKQVTQANTTTPLPPDKNIKVDKLSGINGVYVSLAAD